MFRAIQTALLLVLGGASSACSSDEVRTRELQPDSAVEVDPDEGGQGSANTSGGTDGRVSDSGSRDLDARPGVTDGGPPANPDAAPSPGGPDGGDAGVPDQPPGPFEGEGDPWMQPAPRATCAAGDREDGEISGLSGDLRCNLETLGQVEAPHFVTFAWYEDCAYVNGADGTTVIQVAPDGTPAITATLTQVGFRANWESMKASQASGLLVGYESNGATLAIADLTQDCAHPEVVSSIVLSGWVGTSIGHAGGFSPDGTIYYASSMYTGEVFAVDLADPQQPNLITSDFEAGAHDLFVGKNGTRGYFTIPDVATQAVGIGSFAVMDLTQVQARAPDAKGTVISETTWEDGSTSQYPILLSYLGEDYLFVNDEAGSGNCDNPDEKPVWGYGRIFNLSDEKNPKLVSLIKTEANEPQNCETAATELEVNLFGVSTHYCSVDRLDNPRLLSCGIQAGGVRVYDIRNPWRPKEIAYFSVEGEAVPGMQRIHTERRELWLATQPGTFYVLKFRPGSVADRILSESDG